MDTRVLLWLPRALDTFDASRKPKVAALVFHHCTASALSFEGVTFDFGKWQWEKVRIDIPTFAGLLNHICV